MTATDADLDAFWRAIDAAPGDLAVVGKFADYLDEIGHPWAEPLAWCRDTGRVPKMEDGESLGWCRRFGGNDYPASAALGSLWDSIDRVSMEWEPGERLSRSYKRLCLLWLASVAADTDPAAP